jgi:hypothetical protein
MLHATRPEDKIYGMYGCAKRLGMDWPTPDYTKSVAQIYTEATVTCFRYDKDIKVVIMAIGPAVGELGLPSWVPELSGPINASDISKPPRVTPEFQKDKQCSGASRCEWKFIPDGRHLKVKGRRFDYVAVVGEAWRGVFPTTTPQPDHIEFQNLESLMRCIVSWFGITLQRNMIRGNSTNLEDELVATSDLADLLAKASLDSVNRVAEDISLLIDCLRGINGYQPTSRKGLETIVRVYPSIALLAWKLVFRTANKLCMGTSNYNAKAGDLLVVFHGLGLPCLIRPCAGGFNFIGSAFVPEVMNGEFWGGGSKNDDEWFTLI